MKAILTSLAAILFLNSFAQTDVAPVKARKYQIGFSVSADYCNRNLSAESGNATANEIMKSREKYETGKVGATLGFNALRELNDHWALELGLYYSSKGFQVDGSKLEQLTFGDKIDPRRGFVVSDEVGNLQLVHSIRYSYDYFDIPLRATYSFGKGKLRYQVGAGVFASVFWNESVATRIYLSDGTKHKYSGSDTYMKFQSGFGPLLAAGISYKVGERGMLRAEPAFKYGLVPTVKAPISERLWTAGLSVGFYLSL